MRSVPARVVLSLLLLGGCPGSTGQDPCAAVTCAQGSLCVGGACVEAPDRCFGVVCPEGTSCVGGQCVSSCNQSSACPEGSSCCEAFCVDTRSNTAHCGSCGHSCGATGDTCTSGACACGSNPPCSGATVCCSGSCLPPTPAGGCPGTGCGNGTCESGESCQSCPADCSCSPGSGDHHCDPATEGCQSCPADCGKCPAGCGDSFCDPATESCQSCPADCAKCPAVCGDQQCDPSESCQSCPADCNPCPAICGDGKCDAGETCQGCPGDCQPCECTAPATDLSVEGCAPCQQKVRTCQASGSWGPFSACSSICTSTKPYCVNGLCAVCQPQSSQNQVCPCGTQTRTCTAAGIWGSWSSCLTSCLSPNVCLSGRCGRQYSAFSTAGGPYCGQTYSGTYYTSLFCAPGDFCLSVNQRLCQSYQDPQPGDSYHAYQSGGGALCGERWSGSYNIKLYCQPGDHCSSASSDLCVRVGTACGALYDAYPSAGGPECGKIWTGSYDALQYCQGGDLCSSASSRTCKIARTCGPGALYTPYPSAGGAECGKKWSGTYWVTLYCQPYHKCLSTVCQI